MKHKGLPIWIQYLMVILAVIILFPIFLIVFFLIYFLDKKPIFFAQNRITKNEKVFKLWKFRTMNKDGKITKLGYFLRKYSLDELPQLFNILKGDMLLIGPRPLLPEYLPLYSEEQKKRHLLKAGLTGWTQINGRNALNWEQKFQLDIWYVENQSFLLDIKILLITLKKILFKADGNITSELFNGKN